MLTKLFLLGTAIFPLVGGALPAADADRKDSTTGGILFGNGIAAGTPSVAAASRAAGVGDGPSSRAAAANGGAWSSLAGFNMVTAGSPGVWLG